MEEEFLHAVELALDNVDLAYTSDACGYGTQSLGMIPWMKKLYLLIIL